MWVTFLFLTVYPLEGWKHSFSEFHNGRIQTLLRKSAKFLNFGNLLWFAFNWVNPYLEHFGDVVERHLLTKNPQSYFYFWWRHTSTKIFNFMIIWDHGSSTIYTSLGLITWRHHLEISRDQQKFIKKPGYMVERHLWTKNPHLLSGYNFPDFSKKSYLGTSWSVICGQKIHSYFTRIICTVFCFSLWFIEQRQLRGFAIIQFEGILNLTDKTKIWVLLHIFQSWSLYYNGKKWTSLDILEVW